MKPILGNDQPLLSGRACAVLLEEGTPEVPRLLSLLEADYAKDVEVWVSGDAAFWNNVSKNWQGKKRYLEREERILLTFPAPPFEMDIPRCLLNDVSIIPVSMNTVFGDHRYRGAIHALTALLEKDRRHELEIIYPQDTLLELYRRFGPLAAILPQPDGRPFLIGDAWSLDVSVASKISAPVGKKMAFLREIKGDDQRLNFENIEYFVSRGPYLPLPSAYKIRIKHITASFQMFVRGVFIVAGAVLSRWKRLMGRSIQNRAPKASPDCDKLFMMDHPLRFHPPIHELKRLIAEGTLGEIRRVDMALGYTGRQKTGEGVLLELGRRLIDLTFCLFGSIRRVEAVSAYDKVGGDSKDVLHSVNALLDNGLPVSIRLSGCDRLTNEITVTGSLATCRTSFDDPTLILHQSRTITVCKNKAAGFTLRRIFPEAISPRSAVETIEWIEKIYRITRRLRI